MNTVQQSRLHKKSKAPPSATSRRAAESHSAPVSNSAALNMLEQLPSREVNLSQAMEQKMQDRFGVPMQGLRVFEDQGLGESGQRGYARGNEIHVATGQASNADLLMHEAGHVVQAGSGMSVGAGILESPTLEHGASGGFSAPAGFSMPTSGAGPVMGAGKWDKFKKKASGVGNWLAETGKNIGSGVLSAGKGIGHAVAHPIETAKGIGREGKLVAMGGIHMARKKFNGVRNALGDMSAATDAAILDDPKSADYKKNHALGARFRAQTKRMFTTKDFRTRRAQKRTEARKETAAKETALIDELQDGYGSSQPFLGDAADYGVSTEGKTVAGAGGPAGMIGTLSSLGASGIGAIPGTTGFSDFRKDSTDAASKFGVNSQVIGGLGSGLGMLGDASSAVSEGLQANRSRKMGNNAEATSSAMGVMSKAASFAGNAMQFAGSVGGSGVMAALAPYAPIAGIVGGGVDTVRGLHDMGRASRSRKHLDKRLENTRNSGSLILEKDMAAGGGAGSNRQKLNMKRTLEMFRSTADADHKKASYDTAAGVFKTAGGVATLAGGAPGAIAGTALGLLGTGVGIAGGLADGERRRNTKRQQVDNEIGLDSRIAKLREAHPELSNSQAKHAVLKSMGFASGKRGEVQTRMINNRATALQQAANADDSSEAAKILREIGLSRKDDGYSFQAIAEKLGAKKG